MNLVQEPVPASGISKKSQSISTFPFIAAILIIPILAAIAAALGFRGSDVLLGIDLGTTYSALAVSNGGGSWRGGKNPIKAALIALKIELPSWFIGFEEKESVRVIQNLDGGSITPSVVAIDGANILIGASAVRHLEKYPNEGVVDSKRVIGRRRGDKMATLEAKRHSGRLLLHPQAFRSILTGKPFIAHVPSIQTNNIAEKIQSIFYSLVSRISATHIGRKFGLGAFLGTFSVSRPCPDCEREPSFAIPLLRQTDAEIRVLATNQCIDLGSLVYIDPIELANVSNDAIVIDEDDNNSLPWNFENDIQSSQSLKERKLPMRLLQLAKRHGNPRHYLFLTPQSVSCLVLGYLKSSAIKALPHVTLGKACACIPAEFDSVQRRATLEGFSRAGIHVVRTLHEPTAAAAAYGLQHRADIRFVLVFDMGGGTLDVSVLFLGEGGAFTTIGTAGDNSLGGEDFDDCIAHQLEIKKSKEETFGNGKKLSCSSEALSIEAERIKIALGTTESTSWKCNDYTGTFTRVEFNQACNTLFDRSIAPVLQALDNANVRINEVDELVLVGGSSRLLGVRERLKDLFQGRELRTTVDPDLAVALGAAASRV
jgi:actin-like ATPase involved in cell morphogenesis